MPVNFDTLFQSENILNKMFFNYFEHINWMHEYIYSKIITNLNVKNKDFEIIKIKENESDKFEISIINEANWIISKETPRANHLRFIISIIRSVKDLERMGDFAYNTNCFFENNRKISLNERKIIESLSQKSILITKKIYQILVEKRHSLSNIYSTTIMPLLTKFSKDYTQSFDLLGKSFFNKKNDKPKFFIFSILKYFDRYVDHAINIFENFIYINNPLFLMNKNKFKI